MDAIVYALVYPGLVCGDMAGRWPDTQREAVSTDTRQLASPYLLPPSERTEEMNSFE